MAFPTTPVLDDFNRADGALGANWANQPFGTSGGASTMAVISSLAAVTGAANVYCEQWWTTAYPNVGGIECWLMVKTLPDASSVFNGFWMGLIQQPAAGANTADGYQAGFEINTGVWRVGLFKYTNAVEIQLGGFVNLPSTPVPGDILGIEVKLDGTINIYMNGVVILTQNDVTYFHAGESAFPEFAPLGNTTLAGVDAFGGGQTVTAGLPPITPQLSPSLMGPGR